MNRTLPYSYCIPIFFAASVNPSGGSCPTALKMVACVLMLEITAFLRETYKQLPRAFVKVPKSEAAKADGGAGTTAAGHRAHSRDHGILQSGGAGNTSGLSASTAGLASRGRSVAVPAVAVA